jgi:hypothetical protein
LSTNSTEANARNSPFLRLPGELRNQIYDEAFDDAYLGVYKRLGFFARIFKRNSRSLRGAAAFALLTCKQIRHEALLLLFPAATFYFNLYAANMLRDGHLISYMGQNVCYSITRMVLSQDTVHDVVSEWHAARNTGTPVLPRADYFPCLESVWVFELGSGCCIGHATLALRRLFARGALMVNFKDWQSGEWINVDGVVEVG